MLGLPLALLMLGVPLWYCVGECRQGRIAQIRLFRWWLMCGMLVMIPTLTGLLFGVVGFILSNIPATRPSQISTNCRILSTSVDLRSTKMCTPQLLPDTQQTIQPRSKFRCYFDYYWASVFKVEFEPHLLGLHVQARAEIPREALPAFCRPGFGATWTLKEMYQINWTYPCKYTPGNLEMVEMTENWFANCKADELTVLNLIKQVWIMLFFSEQSIFYGSSQAGFIFWKALAAVSFGMCCSIFVTGFAKTIRQLRFMMSNSKELSDLEVVYFEARLQITCIFVATLGGAVWYIGQKELSLGLNDFLQLLLNGIYQA